MKKMVLLIEDNEQNRDLAVYLLESHGYEVIPAASGVLSLEMAVRRQPELILLDIHLSSMDAYALALALERHPVAQTIPVVAVTSPGPVDEREITLVAGCHGHLEKPIVPETFVAQIERYLQPQNRPRRRTGFRSWMARRTARAGMLELRF